MFADPVPELLEGFQLLLPIGITVVGLDLGHQCFVQPVEVYFVEFHGLNIPFLRETFHKDRSVDLLKQRDRCVSYSVRFSRQAKSGNLMFD